MGKYCSFFEKKLNSDNSVCNCNKKTEKYNVRQIKYGKYLLIVNGISILCIIIIWMLIFMLNSIKSKIEYDFLYLLGLIFPCGVLSSPIIAGIIYYIHNKKKKEKQKAKKKFTYGKCLGFTTLASLSLFMTLWYISIILNLWCSATLYTGYYNNYCFQINSSFLWIPICLIILSPIIAWIVYYIKNK